MKFFNLYGCLQRMTAARSPLNSRGYKVPPDRWMRVTSTPKGSPKARRWATPLGSMLPTASDSVGRPDPRLLRGDAFSVFNRTGRTHVSMPSSNVFFTICDEGAVFCCSFIVFDGFWPPFSLFLTPWRVQKQLLCPDLVFFHAPEPILLETFI